MSFSFALSTPLTYTSFKHPQPSRASAAPSLLPAASAKRKLCLLGLVFSAVFNTGCGGTPDGPMDEASGSSYPQTSNATYAGAVTKSAASSFTVNPTENFNGFNPDDWNNQQSWVECNCGNSQGKEPQIMTWNPNT